METIISPVPLPVNNVLADRDAAEQNWFGSTSLQPSVLHAVTPA